MTNEKYVLRFLENMNENMEFLMIIALLTASFPLLIVAGLFSILRQLINNLCGTGYH